MRSLADAACELPWLSPCAASLVALTREPKGGDWAGLRNDPGLVLLLLRQASQHGAASTFSFYPSLLREAGAIELALQCLDTPQRSFPDWRQARLFPTYRSALSYARAAEAIARKTEKCDPENAWAGGLLAPLGCLAAASQDDSRNAGDAKDNGRAAPVHRSGPGYNTLAIDSPAIGRRLASAWGLPAWFSAVVGHLGLPLVAARDLGADPHHFMIVQLAVLLVGEAGHGLQLSVGATRSELVEALDLPTEYVSSLVQELNTNYSSLTPPVEWQSPASVPLLRDLLRLAATNRKLAQWSERRRLQAEVDALHDAVERQRAGEETRLREMKLRALAELAAGAGHEINNPLAVISGQAQYLLVSEQEPARRKSLQTIVGQTQRIHQTLTHLMQFAKPPPPRKQRVDVGGLLREAAAGLQTLADERQVRLVIGETPAALTLSADPGQLQSTVSGLLRNAVEAAPPGGWAGARVDFTPNAGINIVVEDNGPGLKGSDREHLFDPFYSGRKAGRGRGLGLPAAWQLARQHGGEVRLDSNGDGLTRFVLKLPPEALAEVLPLRIAECELRVAN